MNNSRSILFALLSCTACVIASTQNQSGGGASATATSPDLLAVRQLLAEGEYDGEINLSPSGCRTLSETVAGLFQTDLTSDDDQERICTILSTFKPNDFTPTGVSLFPRIHDNGHIIGNMVLTLVTRRLNQQTVENHELVFADVVAFFKESYGPQASFNILTAGSAYSLVDTLLDLLVTCRNPQDSKLHKMLALVIDLEHTDAKHLYQKGATVNCYDKMPHKYLYNKFQAMKQVDARRFSSRVQLEQDSETMLLLAAGETSAAQARLHIKQHQRDDRKFNNLEFLVRNAAAILSEKLAGVVSTEAADDDTYA